MQHKHTAIITLCASVLSLIPIPALSQSAGQKGAALAFSSRQAFEQDFVITAYYSPLPDQCCYVKGSFEEDVILNGKGTNGADGTEVYPGMIAAPSSYPFGTRVTLPGIGTFTVHDRGGAIVEQGEKHRLDIWVGHGEEGLARALAFGVGRLKGTVYPPGTDMPAESFALESLPAPSSYLTPFVVGDTSLLTLHPTIGQRGLSVEMMQQKLKDAGYFHEAISGFFGPVTKQSIEAFYADMGIEGSSDSLTDEAAALLEAVIARAAGKEPVPQIVTNESASSAIASAQRTLRFLGFYNGRTNGRYDDNFHHAVMEFQKSEQLIAGSDSPGAGRLGPKTRGALMKQWRRKVARGYAEKILTMHRIDRMLTEGKVGVKTFLGRGVSGKDVTALQTFLADKGFFDRSMINGVFGAMTESAVVSYQTDAGIIKGSSDKGAGYVGPATLTRLKHEQRKNMYAIVRAYGWAAL
jgi:peptidoglycan hydrolase-like protein with peptidoglycan-binding domain/3D (Asp-Asp-Asp) domain-containing protein